MTKIKDPNDTLWAQGFDWEGQIGELTVTDSEWLVETLDDDDAPLTVVDDSIVTGNLKTQVRLSGGTSGRTYVVTNRVTLSSGGTRDWSFRVKVEQR